MTGAQLRKVRVSLGLTMTQMAEKTNYKYHSIWKMENGYRKVPTKMIAFLTLLKEANHDAK
jgi:cytoskeletal protein RodZ